MFLSDNEFISIIKSTPLISVDLIIKNKDNHVLLGFRKNRPAKDFWFVPGGRIVKNETVENAFSRIVSSELGIRYDFHDAEFVGVFEHIYNDNFLNIEGVNTHYVVLAYQLRFKEIPVFTPDDQHGALRWWDREALLDSPHVHEYTKAYFPCYEPACKT